jgi:hydroxymethylpyrimidine pyrophosphatase-like HAD family hydrolase
LSSNFEIHKKYLKQKFFDVTTTERALTKLMSRNNRVLVLFDVDGTLTEARGEATLEIKDFLNKLKSIVKVGVVGGSDLVKQQEQLGEKIVDEVDFSFSENGLVAYKESVLIGKVVWKILFKFFYC